MLYVKHGSRYKLATLPQIVRGFVSILIDSGHSSLATDVVERLISSLDKSHASSTDVQLITKHVVQHLTKEKAQPAPERSEP